MAIAEKLEYLNGTKQAIKTAIQNRGVTVSDTDTFRDYATKIGGIGETVDKTKFGVSIDNLLGDVDENGVYNKPGNSGVIVDLSGVKEVSNYAFENMFNTSWTGVVGGIIANDLVKVNISGFAYAFKNCYITVAEFNSLESLEGLVSRDAFIDFNNKPATTLSLVPHFNKLKIVTANNAFYQAFKNEVIDPTETFPLLEEIGGNSSFYSFRRFAEGDEIIFGAVKKITGGTSQYQSTFGSLYIKGTIWKFPSATELTGYIWTVTSSYPGEIHFAAANQAAIEACDGYANKWGFTEATIYFDL